MVWCSVVVNGLSVINQPQVVSQCVSVSSTKCVSVFSPHCKTDSYWTGYFRPVTLTSTSNRANIQLRPSILNGKSMICTLPDIGLDGCRSSQSGDILFVCMVSNQACEHGSTFRLGIKPSPDTLFVCPCALLPFAVSHV